MKFFPNIAASWRQPQTAGEAARERDRRNHLAGEARAAKDREHADRMAEAASLDASVRSNGPTRGAAVGRRPAAPARRDFEREAVQAAIARSRRAAMPAAQRARIDGELARAAGIIAREKSNAPTTTAGVPTLAEEIYAAKNRPGRVDTINERYGRVSRGGVA